MRRRPTALATVAHVEATHWHEKWQTNDLGFHEAAGNQLLHRQLNELDMADSARILVPLCGKAEDMAWLAAKGYAVTGVELSDIAARDFFSEHDIEPSITDDGTFTRYAGAGVEIMVGDFFDLDEQTVPTVAAVYDRAALVALPPEMRTRYATHLADITNCAPQLLITFEYQQDQLAGPPFSISAAEIDRLYGCRFVAQRLDEQTVVGGLRGVAATEVAWLLRKLD